MDYVRMFFFTLDKALYSFAGIIYGLLISIAKLNISEDILIKFGSRIYTLIGIFMLFRVTFSMITYIVDPDKITDKKAGGGKLIVNILISLTLTILMPTIFSYAYRFQTVVLQEDIIGRFILGMGASSNATENAGYYISYTTFSAFFKPEDCGERPYDKNGLTESCETNLKNSTGDEKIIKSLNANYQSQDVLTLDYSLVKKKTKSGKYVMDYRWFISTAAGVILCLIMLTFVLDISMRMIKLGFLQLISPVATISYIDPKQASEGFFKKWTKAATSTYADLFIRLAALYFAIYMISLVTNENAFSSCNASGICEEPNPWMVVFIILGALMFAKKIPDLLKDLFGLDLGGDFTLNPFKKLQKASPLAAGILGFGAGAALQEAANIGKFGRNLITGQYNPKKNESWAKALRGDLFSLAGKGTIRTGLTSAKGGYSGNGYKFGRNIISENERQANEIKLSGAGYGKLSFGRMIRDPIAKYTGGKTEAAKQQKIFEAEARSEEEIRMGMKYKSPELNKNISAALTSKSFGMNASEYEAAFGNAKPVTISRISSLIKGYEKDKKGNESIIFGGIDDFDHKIDLQALYGSMNIPKNEQDELTEYLSSLARGNKAAKTAGYFAGAERNLDEKTKK